MQQKTLLKLSGIKKIISHVHFFRHASTLCEHSFIAKREFSTYYEKQSGDSKFYGEQRFFNAVRERKSIVNKSGIPTFILSSDTLKKFFNELDYHTKENYLMESFIDWLSRYSAQKTSCLLQYFSSKDSIDLKPVCREFIHFCFESGVHLDAGRTLKSFDRHNELSDFAVKKNLIKITPKYELSILGFGLDEGHYEKSIADFLIDQNLAKIVTIYGFDPYASKAPGIKYLTPEQLSTDNTVRFDLVIARWVLHHVEFQQRWENFVKCINHCNPDAMALVIEHGFLRQERSSLDRKIYYLLNATFDIIANIGLRPRYFTSNPKELGADFFISYLTPRDFSRIRSDVITHATQEIYDVGPEFPNQTINCFRIPK